MTSLRIKTGVQQRLFHIDTAKWAMSQDTGLITFTSPDGVTATAPAQIVGTYDTSVGTWLWAWDNPSIQPALAAYARVAQEYGQRHGVPELTTAEVSVPEAKCWEFAAAACELAGGQGVYRGPADGSRVLIAFGTLRLSKSQ